MTHEQFIDALNLYLDGALPPAEAAHLEREISGSPERHRIYRQYCQMQNACTELAERFREKAAPAPFFRRGAVVELPRRASGEWFRSVVLVASGALAACVVFVVVRQGNPPASTPALAGQTPTPVSAMIAAQPEAYPTNAGLTGAPAGFKNPWAGNRETVVDFAQLTTTKQPLLLKAPALGTDETAPALQPYGQAPGAPLRMEEINAAAFQFQR